MAVFRKWVEHLLFNNNGGVYPSGPEDPNSPAHIIHVVDNVNVDGRARPPTHTHTHTHTHTYTHTHAYTHTRTCVCQCDYTYTHKYIHTYVGGREGGIGCGIGRLQVVGRL
jgi:hypothetical protein